MGFCAIFAGLSVRTGKMADGTIGEITVPIRYASADRVVEALGANNATQNKLHTLPMMAAYMTSLELAPERLHGVGGIDRRTFLEQGGVFPNDVKTITRVVPIPYNMMMELSIYASNTDQMYQMLEQILMLFDTYSLQFQFNDKFWDWTRLTTVELLSIGNEENVPQLTERRVIVQTLSFSLPVWLSPPAEIRKEIIQEINIRLGDIDGFNLDQIDEHGNLAPFINEWDHTTITGVGTANDPVIPSSVHTNPPEHYDASLDDCRC
jgi:hypothetical protein